MQAGLRMQLRQQSTTEAHGLAALELALKTGAPLHRRYLLGLRTEPVSQEEGCALWSDGHADQLVVLAEEVSS